MEQTEPKPIPPRLGLDQVPIHAHGCIACGRSVPCQGERVCPLEPKQPVEKCLACGGEQMDLSDMPFAERSLLYGYAVGIVRELLTKAGFGPSQIAVVCGAAAIRELALMEDPVRELDSFLAGIVAAGCEEMDAIRKGRR